MKKTMQIICVTLISFVILCAVIIFLFAFYLANKKDEVYPNVLRFGDVEKKSSYVFINDGRREYSAFKKLSNVIYVDKEKKDKVSSITLMYKGVGGLDSGVFLSVSYSPNVDRYHDIGSSFFNLYLDPKKYSSNLMKVEGLDHYLMRLYNSNDDEGVMVSISAVNDYESIIVTRRKIIATVCRVRAKINKDISLDFHFSSKKSLEEDIKIIIKIIEDIKSRIHLIKEN